MSSQCTAFMPALITVSWTAGTYSTLLVSAGFGYSPGDVFTMKGTLFGGLSPQNDLTLIPTVSQTGVIVTLAIAPGATAPAGSGSITVSYELVRDKNTRDASDITRRIKERIIHVESQTSSPINSYKYPEMIQSNQYRLSYIYGKLNCGACVAGAFNLNGAVQGS